MSKRAEQAALNAFPVFPCVEDILEGKRICFMMGFNQAELETKERALEWMRQHIDDYIDCYSDRCQLMRDFEKAMEE